ncbi:MAG: hypothetical protein A2571_01625 [Candidatus Vogelbacteria bacterium RIFOXYD1_FULL_44_32]|uniref:DNA 3'-5' helicase n=1 Tax=Candidatus Vogelbacteria bacterium RIFOXYD1_FULL_44_32 TaxID=1802438 RepID=A0A1G2QEG0_9BACT|nr:MAG: hypothetical protein A2571_01625 [Candidatus Vogelbacteria bacterium RIFOXYD1_FULL_44_32]
MSGEKNFQKTYNNLNSAQKEAVDTIEGPVMVIAGPGTGKTQILTMRIANILRATDSAPEQILALTFTENATANMRDRLAHLIGSRAYRVVISTFHGFCNNIIKNYPEEFPRIIGSASITEIDQIAIVEKIIDSLPLKLLRPYGDPTFYVRSVVGSIGDLKREGVSVAEYKNICRKADREYADISDLRHEKGAYKGKIKKVYEKLRREIDKNLELAEIYEAYEASLNEKKLYDFNDMIMEVLRELKSNTTLLAMLQEEHQYILVDEHQDTNNAQNKILELIAGFHSNPNLFVVGDEKQAIFRFQGASLENFFYFSRLYPKAKIITLANNYRSGQAILDQAEAVLSGKSPLVAFDKKVGPLIKVGGFDSPVTEYFYLASDIQAKITAGAEPNEIAVLYRDNRDALPLSAILRKCGLAVAVESDDDLLSDLDVQKMITVFEALANFGDNERLARLLHIDFFGLAPIATYKYIRQAHEEKRDLIAILQEKEDRVFELLSSLKVASENMNLLPFMERLLKESKLIEFVVTDHNARGRLETIATFFDLASSVVASQPGARLADFLAFLNIAQKHKVLLKKKAGQGYKGKVRLMTTHKAKGLEFDHVYIVGAYDGHFGGRPNRDKLKLLNEVYALSAESQKAEAQATDDADERRLFYVALTRGKSEVTITYAKIGETGREQVPSRFVTDLRPELVQVIETEKWNNDSKTERSIFLLPERETGSSLHDVQFVAELFHEQGLSVTALNNYLTCPWQYFYRNLIRLPAVPAKYLLYGIAIHAALQDVFRQGKDKGIERDFLLASFERHLRAQPLEVGDFSETLAKGQKALAGWYDTYSATFNLNVLTEFKITGVLLTPGIKLVGSLDKLEFLGDGQTVNVVDYKTGQPKSRNQILGETKDADGNYFRQLVFYKLLLDLFEDKKYQMVSGEIDFVEPSDSGKYKKEKFEVTEADVTSLKTTIETVATEILNLSFWDKTCDDAKCEYCGLRRLMK